MLRDGTGVELEAEDSLTAIYRLSVTMVALDQDVTAKSQAALAQRHGEMTGAIVQVVDGRRMDGNAALVHLFLFAARKEKEKFVKICVKLLIAFLFTLKKARQPPLDWKAGIPTTVT